MLPPQSTSLAGFHPFLHGGIKFQREKVRRGRNEIMAKTIL